jgi:hypothetical protein
MVAGLNIRIDVWQMSTVADDDVGGAMITGTVLTQDLEARLSPRRPSQLMLEQGLETERIFDLIVAGHNVTVRERDEIEVVWPLDHPLYANRFRVVGVQYPSRRAKYGPLQFTLSRIERSRTG